MQKYKFSLSKKFLILICAILFPVIVGFSYSYTRDESIVKRQVLESLTLLADAYEGQIYSFIDMNKMRVEDFSSDGFIKTTIEKISQDKKKDNALLNRHLIKNKLPLSGHLSGHIKNILVMNLDGRVVASTSPVMNGKDVSRADFFLKGKKGTSVLDGFFDLSHTPELAISTPVKSAKTGKTIGVISNIILLSEIDAVLSGKINRDLGALSWRSGKLKTMEVYLVDSNKRVIASSIPLRLRDAKQKQRIETLPVKTALESGKEISAFYKDYRGVDVAGASMYLPNLKWTLIVKYDTSEAFASLVLLQKSIMVTGVVVMSVALLLFLYFYQKVVSYIKHISSKAAIMANGDYSINIPIRTNDEIGGLASTFNRMASEIRQRKLALLKTAERLTKAQSIARMGSWEWDLVRNMVTRSAEVNRIFGSQKDETRLTFEAFLEDIHSGDRDLIKKSLNEAIHERKPYSVDYRIVRPDGEVRYLHGEAEVTFDEADKAVKVMGTVQNITERKKAEEEERKRLERIALQRSALLYISKRFVAENFDVENIFKRITEISAKTLNVERVSVWLLENDARDLRCTELFTLSNRTHTSGTVIQISEYMEYFEALESGRTIDMYDAKNDIRTKRLTEKYLKPLGITSMLDAPVRVSGKVVGVVCHEHTGPLRRWTEDEKAFAADIADQTAAAIIDRMRQKSDKALRMSEVRYRTLFETAPDAIITIDETMCIRGFNGSAERVFGYNSSEIMGRNVKVLLPDRYHRRHEEAVRRLLKTGYSANIGKTREYEALRKGGTEFPISISMAPAHRDGSNLFLAIIRDITERKQKALEMKKLSSAIEQSMNIVFITDREGKIEYVNPVFEEVTEYTKEDALGQDPRLLSSGDTSSHLYEEMWDTILAGRTWRGTLKNRKKKSGTYWCNTVISPIMDERDKITHFMAIQEDITEKVASQHTIEFMTSHDDITGLFNRFKFTDMLDRWILSATARGEVKGAIFLVDIDRFKSINETYGHATGNTYLRRMGKILRDITFSLHKRYISDDLHKPLIAKLSGDEYAVFLPSITGKEASGIAETMRKRVEESHFFGEQVSMTISTGIVLYPDHGTISSELLVRVDAAMYRAKELGRNRSHLFMPGDVDFEKSQSSLVWKKRILKGLKDDRFVPYLQPILHLKDNSITHYEVLARMEDEDGAIVSPGAFINVAERNGLVGSIDRMIIRKAIKFLRKMREKGKEVCLSLNLSGIDLGDKDFLSFLQKELSGQDYTGIIFEVTETEAVRNIDDAVKFIDELKALGCRFSLDDFGVGFTSFVYLKEMAVDFIKIDGSFIRKLHENPHDQLFVKAMIDVARGMGIKTIAEFVETREALELLKSYNADYAQGYYIGRPSPEADIFEAEK